jgi:Putative Ig domain
MKINKVAPIAAILICFSTLLASQTSPTPLAIVDEPLAPIEAGEEYHVSLHATGGTAPYVWTVAADDLPPGINLTPEGLLTGKSTKPGTYTFTVKVEDAAHPSHTSSREFKAVVAASMLLEWVQPPKVRDNRIDGVAQVSNTSTDNYDLTVVIVAVAENGRATAIGYEHFDLKPGAISVQIPFGNTLPHGAYVIHADAIAEVPTKKTILRQRLQTPQALQVVVGP